MKSAPLGSVQSLLLSASIYVLLAIVVDANVDLIGIETKTLAVLANGRVFWTGVAIFVIAALALLKNPAVASTQEVPGQRQVVVFWCLNVGMAVRVMSLLWSSHNISSLPYLLSLVAEGVMIFGMVLVFYGVVKD